MVADRPRTPTPYAAPRVEKTVIFPTFVVWDSPPASRPLPPGTDENFVPGGKGEKFKDFSEIHLSTLGVKWLLGRSGKISPVANIFFVGS